MTKPTHELAARAPTDLWTEFDQVFDDLRGRFYDAFGVSPLGASPSPAIFPHTGFRAAASDLKDTGKSFEITAELPGIPKERLDVRIRGNSVELRAEQKQETERKEDGFLHRERAYHGFYRAFELPEPVVAEKANARLENGVLHLELPKLAPTPPAGEVRVKVE